MWTRDDAGQARLGGARLSALFADPTLHTPAYVYDLDGMAGAARALEAGFDGAPHLIAYAVKANSAGPVIRALAEVGCGADVVSGGELRLALACGVTPDRVLYSGVAKTSAELDLAIGVGDEGIRAIQAESVEELARIDGRARALGRTAKVSLRVNPGVVADTHAHVATGHDEAKFGIARGDLPRAWAALRVATHLRLVGLSCHVGSQLTQTDDYLASASALIAIAKAYEQGHPPLAFIDFGGGFGVDYGQGCAVTPADFARSVTALVVQAGLGGRTIGVEPGRSLTAPFGVLCASVIQSKVSGERRWLMIDAGMNDLLRPALYAAHHRIESITSPPPDEGEGARYRVVGPVCESSDDFGEHAFTAPLPDRVGVRDAGAYGYTMASQYNGRAMPTEVFLRGGEIVHIERPRGVEAWVKERAF